MPDVLARRTIDEGGTKAFDMVAVYDFNVHGGAIGDIEIAPIPKDAVLTYGFISVRQALASGGMATVAIASEAAADLLAATAIASVTGFVALIPDHAPANFVQLTEDRKLRLTVAAAALTAGVIEVRLCGYVPVEV